MIEQIYRISAYGLVLKDSQILLCRISEQIPEHVGKWTLPGGGINFGEEPEDAMVREVFEETGLNVSVAALAGLNNILLEMGDKHYQNLRVIYHANLEGGELTFEKNGTTDMCGWFKIGDVGNLELVELADYGIQLINTK